MKPRLILLTLVVGLQTAWLLGTTLVQERGLSAATVLLETMPVDPRDLLRGDFVILNYKISDLPVSLFQRQPAGGYRPGQQIYVTVEPRGEFHQAVAASTSPLAPTGNQVIVRAKVQTRPWDRAASIHVEYGLERYYVREGTGNPRGKLTVQAAVSRGGRAQIKEVFIDGRPYAEAMRDQAQ